MVPGSVGGSHGVSKLVWNWGRREQGHRPSELPPSAGSLCIAELYGGWGTTQVTLDTDHGQSLTEGWGRGERRKRGDKLNSIHTGRPLLHKCTSPGMWGVGNKKGTVPAICALSFHDQY